MRLRTPLVQLAIFLAVLAFTFTTLTPAGRADAFTLLAYDCEGDACAVLTLAWEEEGQRFRADNSSDRRVRVEVTTFAGASRVSVEPRKSAHLEVKYFNGPYRADYE